MPYRDRFEMYADEERRQKRSESIVLVGALLALLLACVMGVMSCRARMAACEKAHISFWLCFDDSTRLVVPLDDGAGHSASDER